MQPSSGRLQRRACSSSAWLTTSLSSHYRAAIGWRAKVLRWLLQLWRMRHSSCTAAATDLGCSPRPSSPVVAQDSTRSSRSEEHTSELQSPCNIVCRLLLEKKNEKKIK